MKKVKSLLEELEKKDKGMELSERWNVTKLNQLHEKITEKDSVIKDLIIKSKELSKELNTVSEEKNYIALQLNEMEINEKESKKQFNLLLNKERLEREDTERRFLEEIGTVKEENLFLKKQIQDYKIMQENLEDEVIKLKSTVSKTEKMLKLEEQSFKEQMSLLNENHQERIREMEQMKKNEVSTIKEEFSEIEKNLRQRISLLENRRNDLEKQIIDRDAQIMETKALAEEKVEEMKMKMKNDEEKMKKQMEEKIELLESAKRKQDDLLKEQLQVMHEIKQKCTENDLLLAAEGHKTDRLQHDLEYKDAEMKAAVAKVKLEVKEQLEELSQTKVALKDALAENVSLGQKIIEIEKEYNEEILKKDQELEGLKQEVKRQESKVKEVEELISSFQTTFTSQMNSIKLLMDVDSKDKLNHNS